MPGITGSAALDLAIGMILVFYIFALVVSGLTEAISRKLEWRAKFLEEGLRNMLSEPPKGDQPDADRANGDPESPKVMAGVLDHPLVLSLRRHGSASDPESPKLPSYIPSRTFALAVLDTLAPPPPPDAPKEGDPPVAGVPSRDVLAEARATAGKITNVGVQKALLSVIDQARGDIDQARVGLENWFDDSMDRVSGWYKRRAQICAVVIALGVAAVFNVDSFQVANTLWTNGAVRSAVVAEANKVKPESTDGTDRLKDAAARVDKVQELKLPLGWSTDAGDPRDLPSGLGWLSKVLGIVLSGFAISLGAPFWYDLLGKASRLRSTGPKPDPAKS